MEQGPLRIDTRLLLAVYLIVPLLLLAVMLDMFVFGSYLRTTLPATPYAVFFFALLFNVPHHVASTFGFFDKEYLKQYRARIFIGLPLLLAGYGVFAYFFPLASVVFFILYTEYHVLSQQMGVAKMFERTSSTLETVWKILGILLSATLYALFLSEHFNTYFVALLQNTLFPFLLILFLCVSVAVYVKLKTVQARLMCIGIATSLSVPFLFLALGYPLFAVVIARVIHDLTAFVFYITHDYNRNTTHTKNVFYQLATRTGLPLVVLTPVLAVLIAYALQHSPFIPTTALVFLFISHYYLEGFMWKRDAPHRAHIFLTK